MRARLKALFNPALIRAFIGTWAVAAVVLFAVVLIGLSALGGRVTRIERQQVVINRTITRIQLCQTTASCRVLLDELITAATRQQRQRLVGARVPSAERLRRVAPVIVRRLVRRHRANRVPARHPVHAATPAPVLVLRVAPLAPAPIIPAPVLNPAGHAPPGLQPGSNPGHGGQPPGQAGKTG